MKRRQMILGLALAGTLAAVWKLMPICAPHSMQLPIPSLLTAQSL